MIFNDKHTIVECIDELIAATPAQSVAIVGAGSERSQWFHAFMRHAIPKVTLLEADGESCAELRKAISGRKEWKCYHQLVASLSGPAQFHLASITAESSLFPPSLLRDAWVNISLRKTITRPAKTIAETLSDLHITADWLWIDCLPALAILAGAGPDYDGFNVICARVLKEESHDIRTREATLECVKYALESQGFGLVAYEPEMNPMIGHALFVRGAESIDVMPSKALKKNELFTLKNHEMIGEIAGFDIGDIPAGIEIAVQNTLASDDTPQAVSSAIRLAGYTPRECYHYLMGVALAAIRNGDRMYGAGLLNEAANLIHKLPLAFKWHLVKSFLRLGLVDDAYESLISNLTQGSPLEDDEREKISAANRHWKELILSNKGHGHEMLISFIKRHAQLYRNLAGDQKPVLIEVGTTRESASGQGSTRRLMDICAEESIHFITVDMDSANTEMAKSMFEKNGHPFEAVHSKGEDYLEAYGGRMDFVFLDAYDFDHGKHSERRQARYEKFLGSRIDEMQCYKMHFDCARSCLDKLSELGVVCIDDTWLHDGEWTAKGTLAVPFLMDAGMKLLDVRNNSALLGGTEIKKVIKNS
jgi:hypothetical protein